MEKEEHNSRPNFTKRLIFLLVPVFLVVLIWFGGLIKERIFIPKPTHIHAGFIVVKNNQIEDFSDWKYMRTKPCPTDQKPKNTSPEEVQQERAHLHEQVGDVVHVEREGALWKDLFKNIKYPIDYRDSKAFVDGVPVNNFQNKKIIDGESLVIFVGQGNDENQFLQQQVSKEHIQEIAKLSEDCGV